MSKNVISRYFGIESVSFYFLGLKLSLLDIKIRKKDYFKISVKD